MSFKPVNPRASFPELEKEILSFWEKERIFEKSLEKKSPKGDFIFFEGPPTANGKPGIHHVLARAFKDVIPRYKTMQGYRVRRKAGWDTHGLPVELEVEKKLGISGKPQIEKLKETPQESIIEFNKKCKGSVWQYKSDWENLTKRMGFWVDMRNPYITYENSYIESVWWVFSQAYKKKLVYKGHKVVLYCPRCGTALSSHEVAQGYKTVKDLSVTLEFKLKPRQKIGDFTVDDKTHILAWTTTPWTLPGNVALAVGDEVDYVLVRGTEGENPDNFILAKDRLEAVFKNAKKDIITEFKGKELVGLNYEPLFAIDSILKSGKKVYYVTPADFVTTTDGTGVVHTAVMYGEEDYNLGIKIDLPKIHTVDEEGKFIKDLAPYGLDGLFVKDEATEKKILEYLESLNLLFDKEPYEHEYPFCWRCDTPLLYYARNSWFIAMSKLQNELKANNKDITWVPEHIKDGRFGEWLDGVKDWAISRDRYWGSPLPIWQCQTGEMPNNQASMTKGCGKTICIGNITELKEKAVNFDEAYPKKRNNTYTLVRHGESEANTRSIMSSVLDDGLKLTKNGVHRIKELKKSFKNEEFDFIYASPLLRTKETAKLLAGDKEIIFDKRLMEIKFGILEGKGPNDWWSYFENDRKKYFTKKIEGGENWVELERRMGGFFDELEKKHQGKNILIISHGDPLLLSEKYLTKLTEEECLATKYIQPGGSKKILPYDFDLHKPYIDQVKLKCKCGGEMQRTPEVMDCWFDSGSMPYAQWNYLGKRGTPFDKNYPADFISEAMDQTRGWFYTLHAISTFLGLGNCYKNVICLGHVLDEKGQKMSKSKGNMLDPMIVGDKHGFDAIRWYFYTNNQPGEPKLVGEEAIKDQVRRFFLILWNVYSFFVMYAELKKFKAKSAKRKTTTQSANLFDSWLVSRKNQTIKKVTESLDKYDLFTASRSIEDFVIELSTWYIRRNKKRGDKDFLQTLYETLVDISKLLAPFAPFISEEIFRNLTCKTSVHLEKWLEFDEKLVDAKLEHEMEKVKQVVELGHAVRKEKSIKVRQPLSELRIMNYELREELKEIVIEELNVKSVGAFHETPEKGDWAGKEENGIKLALNIELTPELKAEGLMRDFLRLTQDARKEAGYAFNLSVSSSYSTTSATLKDILTTPSTSEPIKKRAILSSLEEGIIENADIKKDGEIGGFPVTIYLKK